MKNKFGILIFYLLIGHCPIVGGQAPDVVGVAPIDVRLGGSLSPSPSIAGLLGRLTALQLMFLGPLSPCCCLPV